ncbi:MAG: site-specific DNA-methyltransferase, partial [Enhygromyxa sp.]
ASDHCDRPGSTGGGRSLGPRAVASIPEQWQDRRVPSPERARAARRAIEAMVEAGAIEADVGYLAPELAELMPDHDPQALSLALEQLARALERGPLMVRTSGGPQGPRYHFCERPVGRRVDDDAPEPGAVELILANNMDALPGLPSAGYRLIYIDPPFNTGRDQVRKRLRTRRVEEGGDRTGFHGARYQTTLVGQQSFEDSFADHQAFLEPRLREAHRLLSEDGSLFLHLDYREVHYAKVLLDRIFGRESFINEIIWAYDYGARTRSKWSAKHDNILWYAKDPKNYVFHHDAMDRIPYMAPGLVGPEKAARGKTPTDVWWHTIVAPGGRERTGYPTQKPLGILRRIVNVHSSPGDRLLDFFAGSGSFGEAGARAGRRVTLIDSNPEAIEVMSRRLAPYLVAPPAAC